VLQNLVYPFLSDKIIIYKICHQKHQKPDKAE